LARLDGLAQVQGGMFTTQQGAAKGVDTESIQALVSKNLARRVLRNVYELVEQTGFSHREAYALWLSICPNSSAGSRQNNAILSHSTALNWMDPLMFGGAEITVSVPPGTSFDLSRVRMIPVPLTSKDWCILNGVPTTTLARTIVDVLEDDEEDFRSLGRRLHGLAEQQLCDLNILAVELDGYARANDYRSGNALLKLMLEASIPDSEHVAGGLR
jgi:hypothetical protein